MISGTQSLTSTTVPTGKIGVWWFLASEIMVFGGLITSYIVIRLGGPGWSAETEHLQFSFALVNTLVLLTSSFTMVLAFAAAEDNDQRKFRIHLGWTIVLGLVFLGIKAFEYGSEISRGFTPGAGIFWSFYYGMTGLHALHVFGGIVVNIILFIFVSRSSPSLHAGRVELAGLYWHFVDIVWIFLFPLLYLT